MREKERERLRQLEAERERKGGKLDNILLYGMCIIVEKTAVLQ